MKYLITLFIAVIAVIALAGCVGELPESAYDAVSESCQKQGKVMYVEKLTSRIIVECIDPDS